MLASVVTRPGTVLVDTRDTEDITSRGRGIDGHLNIPWSSFHLYESRIRNLRSIFSSNDVPIVLYADREAAQSAVQFKEALERRCGYTNVHSCESVDDLIALNPALKLTDHPNLISHFVDDAEIRVLYEQGAVIIDSRDPDEIEREKDSLEGHINIPWSTFSRYSSRLNEYGDKLLGSNEKGKDSPILVFWCVLCPYLFSICLCLIFCCITAACEGAERCFSKMLWRSNAGSRMCITARTQAECTRHSLRFP